MYYRQTLIETTHNLVHISDLLDRMAKAIGTDMVIRVTETMTMKEIITKGVVRVIHIIDRVIGRAVGKHMKIGDSGHADFGM